MPTDDIVDATVRAAIPLVIAALVRRYGDLADCEDAVQEALLEATTAWPRTGRPDDVRAWLLAVARRRYIDAVRSDVARRAREERDLDLEPREAPAPSAHDDSLALLVLCCHPALEPTTQVALTLRAVCGLTTPQIAAAFYATEAAMTRRISRAKRAIDDAGRDFSWPGPVELEARIEAMRAALLLMFNEGYAPADGELPVHSELVAEAIRLTRLLHTARLRDRDTTALLALMLLTDARTPARTDGAGMPIPLPEQDRALWRGEQLAEGRRLAAAALAEGPLTPLRVQAALAEAHAVADSADDTDWGGILALYDLLERVQPGPATALGRAAALGMAHGPQAGLAALAALEDDARVASGHRLAAVRAGLLERAGLRDAAADAYATAAARAANRAERRWLAAQVDRLHDSDDDTESTPEGTTP